MKRKRCVVAGCDKSARGAKYSAHGGGKRCVVDGCSKGAEGATDKCKGHGGGKMCVVAGFIDKTETPIVQQNVMQLVAFMHLFVQ
jgi:hypothetical protein